MSPLPEPTYADYLLLRKTDDPPPPPPQEDDTRFYADSDGALRSLQSNGTDAPVAGAGVLPDPTDDGDVLTVVEGEWAGAAPQSGGTITVPVSSLEILALADTDVGLIEGVPGFVTVVNGVNINYLAGGTPYTDAGGFLVIATRAVITSDHDAVWTQYAGIGFVDEAASQTFLQGFGAFSVSPAGQQQALSELEGQDVYLYYGYSDPPGTNLTDGDGTLVVTVSYFLAPTA